MIYAVQHVCGLLVIFVYVLEFFMMLLVTVILLFSWQRREK